MARQYLQDGGLLEAAITDPLAANAATTATNMYNALRYALIPAYDARPGKVYVLEAGGLITTGATGALTIAPFISTAATSGGTTLGTSIAQTVPATSLSGPFYMRMVLVVLTTGDPGGSNATIKGTGFFQSGGVAATSNSGLDLTFGGTSAAFDHSVNNCIRFDKTLSVAGSMTVQFVLFTATN
jgi:hypothetical protein